MDDGGEIFEFGSFSVDPQKRRLCRDRVPVALNAKAFDALVVLIRNAGRIVSRDALFDAIWDDTTVEDNNLTQQISTLRKTLGEMRGDDKFIATLPGKGYCFVVPVEQRKSNEAAASDKPSKITFGLFTIDRGRRIGFAAAFLYIFMCCSPFFYSAVRTAVSGSQPQSLAVLQFKADRGDEFLSTGISETLRARLGSVEDLMVLPGAPLANDGDVLSVGRELKVDSIVTGSVQRAEDRIRVTVEMVDVGDGRVVWGKTFDDRAVNIFALQDSIAGEVASALHVRLMSEVRLRLRSVSPAYAS